MTSGEQRGRRARGLATAAAVLLAGGGACALAVGAHAQQHPPQPPASAAVPAPTGPASAGSRGTGPGGAGSDPSGPHASSPGSIPTAQTPAAATGPVLPRAVPVRLDIPAIGVHSPLEQLGTAADDTVQVPPLGKDSPAGWYRYSPTPGQVGPAVILGHVDSAQYGPAVFFRLGALRQGNQVNVARADGTVAVFAVDRVVRYAKDAFPTLEVYGNTDRAALRLITCGGSFDASRHSYTDNIVVYASLVSSHRA